MAEDVVEDAELRDELLRRAEVDQQARRACTRLFAKARDGMVHPNDLTPDEQAIVDRLTEVDRPVCPPGSWRSARTSTRPCNGAAST
jgi:hypothetical protein